MTNRVFKYQADDNGTYVVPDAAPQVLLVAQQDGSVFPVLWCSVNVHEQTGTRVFQCVGTGAPVPADMVFVGSAVCGNFVWHVADGGSP